MIQPDNFMTKGQVKLVCKLHKPIYGLKQASRSWNIHFDKAIKTLDFNQNEDGPCVCVYKRKECGVFNFVC